MNKTLGPVHFERVGIEYRDEKLWIPFDASLAGPGFTVSLDGLAIGAPLKSPFALESD